MFKQKLFLIIGAFLFTLSCSSLKINIDSEPKEADVFVKEGAIKRKLGITPLELNSNTLNDKKNYNIIIEKSGYRPVEVLVEKRALKSTAEIFASLERDNSTLTPLAQSSEDQDKVHRSLASVQSMLIKSEFQQAEFILKNFLIENANSSVGWSLLGNAYLLQNKNEEALSAYNKAMSLDPTNEETSKIIQYLNQSPAKRGR